MKKAALAVLLTIALVGCAHTKAAPTAAKPAAKAPPAAAQNDTEPRQYQGPPPQEQEPQIRLTVSQSFPKNWQALRTPDGTRVLLINRKLNAHIKAQIVPTQAVNPLAIILSVKAQMQQVKGKMKIKTAPGLIEIKVAFKSEGKLLAGKLVLKSFEGTPATAMVIGTWPKKYDRRVLKAFDAYWKSIQIKVEAAPAQPPAGPPAK